MRVRWLLLAIKRYSRGNSPGPLKNSFGAVIFCFRLKPLQISNRSVIIRRAFKFYYFGKRRKIKYLSDFIRCEIDLQEEPALDANNSI